MKGVNTPGQSPGPRPLWRPIPRQSRGVFTPFVLCTRSGTEPTSYPAPLTRLRISERRDLNPRHPPWQGGALPLSYSRIATMYTKTPELSNREKFSSYFFVLITEIRCKYITVNIFFYFFLFPEPSVNHFIIVN